MSYRRIRHKIGDVLLIPIEKERVETSHTLEWAPQQNERCALAQILFTFDVAITLAIYEGIHFYNEQTESLSLENRKITHLIETDGAYVTWGAFKKIRHERVNPKTPLFLYQALQFEDQVTLTPSNTPAFSIPKTKESLSLAESGTSVTGELLISLLRHVYVAPIADGYEEIHQDTRVEGKTSLSEVTGISNEALLKRLPKLAARDDIWENEEYLVQENLFSWDYALKLLNED